MPHLRNLICQFAMHTIEAAGKYVVVRADEANHILRETPAGLEAQLDWEQFLRISRFAIVHLDRIKELQPMFKGESVVVLQIGRQLSHLALCALPQVRRRLILGIDEWRGIQRRP